MHFSQFLIINDFSLNRSQADIKFPPSSPAQTTHMLIINWICICIHNSREVCEAKAAKCTNSVAHQSSVRLSWRRHRRRCRCRRCQRIFPVGFIRIVLKCDSFQYWKQDTQSRQVEFTVQFELGFSWSWGWVALLCGLRFLIRTASRDHLHLID